MPNNKGEGFVDYVLWGDDGKPLAVVEAKRTSKDARIGQQQAKLYADCLEKMKGQRPIIFFTNGYKTWLWDDQNYPQREVQAFTKSQSLNFLFNGEHQKNCSQVKSSMKQLLNAIIRSNQSHGLPNTLKNTKEKH